MNVNNLGYSNNAVNSDKFLVRNKRLEEDKQVKSISEDSLSDKQKDTLDKLKEKYSNMDFYVVDSIDNNNLDKLSDNGSNEYSVFITQDELEKMASDEEYMSKREQDLDDFVTLANKLKTQYESDSEDEDASVITKLSVTFNDDGSTSYFAEIEKSSQKQKERIEAAKEKKAEESRKAAKKEAKEAEQERIQNARTQNSSIKNEKSQNSEKTQIKADSIDDLMTKISDYYQNEKMNTIKTDEEKMVGQRFDFSV